VFAAGAQLELSLLPWLAMEFDLAYGSAADSGFPVLPLLAKIGGRLGQAEIFANIGYTIGAGFTVGGTLGFHAGPGVLFSEFLYIVDGSDSLRGNIFVALVGYKVGIGNKKR
jgi:hypothetical protein